MTAEERFENNCIPEPMSGCWLWTGSYQGHGYGQIMVKRKNWRAHRLAYSLYRGRIPEGLHVLHRCDTPACVNPDHLYLGTHADNMADKGKRRRQPRGEVVVTARLSNQAVKEIRADPRPYPAIASDHSIDRSMVSLIKRGKRWGHVI